MLDILPSSFLAMFGYILSQRGVDPGLRLARPGLEPRQQVGIDPQRDLLLYRAVELAALDAAPVRRYENPADINGLLGLTGEPLQLLAL